MKELIKIESTNGQLMTSSLNVSEVFGKEHARVIRDIREIMDKWKEIAAGEIAAGEINPLDYFIESSYKDLNNQVRPMFFLTKKGTARLVMGYTGDKAEVFKIAYIERFEQMEKLLLENRHNAIVNRTPLDLAANDMSAWMKLAEIFETPKHYALIEGTKYIDREHKVDLTPLLQKSPSMDNIQEEDKLLEPTELGKLIGIGNNKGRLINDFLCKHGMQIKVNGQWEATDQAKGLYSKHAWKHGNKSGYNYKWKSNWFVSFYNINKDRS